MGPPTVVTKATVGMVPLVVDSTHLVDTHTVGESLPDTLTVSQVNLVVSVRALDWAVPGLDWVVLVLVSD
jgi:hypothetical protein